MIQYIPQSHLINFALCVFLVHQLHTKANFLQLIFVIKSMKMRHIDSRYKEACLSELLLPLLSFFYSSLVLHVASSFFFVFVLCKIIKDKILLCYSLCWGLRHDDQLFGTASPAIPYFTRLESGPFWHYTLKQPTPSLLLLLDLERNLQIN